MDEVDIISEAKKTLEQGGVILYPTDTLIGLGCDALNEVAVKKIFEMKGRDDTKPMSIACSDMAMVKQYASLSEEDEKALSDLLPGPFTFVIAKKAAISDTITSGSKFVGVRIPDYPILLAIIHKLGRPIITTSANQSGEADLVAIQESPYAVDFILDTGYEYVGPSTVFDIANRRILREGIGAEKIKQYFNL